MLTALSEFWGLSSGPHACTEALYLWSHLPSPPLPFPHSFLAFIFLCIGVLPVYVCELCALHACCLLRPEEAMWVLGIEPSPLEKQTVLLTSGPSLQSRPTTLFLDMVSLCNPQVSLELTSVLLQLPKCWDFRHATLPHLSPSPLLPGSVIWNKLSNLSESTSSPVS